MKVISVPVRVFVLFACGYFVSYVYRGVNLGFAPYLAKELGTSAADLGLLTSLYFLGFAGAQIPAGILLDRYGPRRVCALLMLIAAAGSVIFGVAQSKEVLMIGRLLIGIGLCVCLGGAYKAIAQWYETRRLPLINGLVVAIGGSAGIMMGSPMLWLLSITDWRSICFGLTILTIIAAAMIWFFAPRSKEVVQHVDFASQLRGVKQIWSSPSFWKVASFTSLTQGIFYALQSLWVSPFLRDVNGLPSSEIGFLVSLLAVAMVIGSIGIGLFARSLERYGISVQRFCGLGMLVFVLMQIAIIVQVPLPLWLLWLAYGISAMSGLLGYSLLAEQFPIQMIGRVNTSFTLLMFFAIFGCQVGIGAVLEQWPEQQGHYPAAAHISAWVLLIVLQLLAAIWYFLPQRKAARK